MSTPAPAGDPVRVLVAGLGSIGQRHVRLLSERPEVEILLCDPVAARRTEASTQLVRPARRFESYEEALAAKPTLVFVCTPNHLHTGMGLGAVAAGADVFVEKPLAPTVREAAPLVAAAAAAGRRLHVGYMLRFDAGLLALKRVVDEGGIGRLCGGRALLGSHITLLNSRERDKETTPGALVVDYTHEFDFILWFFGELAEVRAFGATAGELARRARPNLFQALLRMRSGALVQLHLDYVQHPQRRTFELVGDRGTLHYDFMTGEIRHFGFEAEHRWKALDVAPLAARVDDLYRAEHAAVLRARSEDQSTPIGADAALRALAAAEQALAAARPSATLEYA